MKKVKGIELMQMIADGKIKDGTKINRIDYHKYVFKNGDLYFNGTSDTLRNFFKIKTILEQDFEILEDKTEEIEEIEEIQEQLKKLKEVINHYAKLKI